MWFPWYLCQPFSILKNFLIGDHFNQISINTAYFKKKILINDNIFIIVFYFKSKAKCSLFE